MPLTSTVHVMSVSRHHQLARLALHHQPLLGGGAAVRGEVHQLSEMVVLLLQDGHLSLERHYQRLPRVLVGYD